MTLGGSTGAGAGWIVIRAGDRSALLPWRELWTRRELLWFLVWRDVKIRYKQTAIGAAWALLQPLLSVAVFTVVFGRLARVGSEGVPYGIFALTGMVVWIYFANALGQSSNSLIENERIVSKVYFPRAMLPASPVISGLLDVTIGGLVLLAVVATDHNPLTWRLVAAPFALLLTVVTVFGTGLLLASLNVRFRDVRYAIPFLLQVWLFASPVVYSAALVPDAWRPVVALNPMSTVIDGLRWSVLGTAGPPLAAVLVSTVTALAILFIGSAVFHRAERSFADVL